MRIRGLRKEGRGAACEIRGCVGLVGGMLFFFV